MRDGDYVYELMRGKSEEILEKEKEIQALEKEVKALCEELSEIDEADLDETIDTFCKEK